MGGCGVRSVLVGDDGVRLAQGHGEQRTGADEQQEAHLRYVLKQNKEPKNRVAMYLNVQAGSLQETEEQRGVAHYLEHMLFNGTTHYPPGTLVEYFQGIGMDFGADTNAHTSYDETVYQLILPDGREKTLAEGYQVLVDYAQGALLLEKEVERERGIIFSEKRTRDSAEARAQKSQMQFDFAGSLIAKRDPIGLDAVLQHADAKLLRSYYERWYRPDNMFVIVVGDFEKGMAEEQLRRHEEYFADFAWRDKSEQYKRVLREYPQLLQRIALKDLAAYLFLTPQSLSRIRAEIK